MELESLVTQLEEDNARLLREEVFFSSVNLSFALEYLI